MLASFPIHTIKRSILKMNASIPDKIIIREYSVHTKIGYTVEERTNAQRIIVNLEISIVPWQSGPREGDLSTTICYATVKNQIENNIKNKTWILLEELALEICSLIFKEFARAIEIKIQLRKFVIPDTKWVGLEFYRTRNCLKHET